MVLDQFAGGVTTLVEAKLLNRDIVGIDVNDISLDRCKEKLPSSTREQTVKFIFAKVMQEIWVLFQMRVSTLFVLTLLMRI